MDAVGGICMICLAVVGVVPMSDAVKKHPPLTSAQREAIKEVEAHGGTVHYKPDGKPRIVESINFRGPTCTDAELACLAPFRGYDLHSLGFVGAKTSEAGVCWAISQFPELKGFSASEMPLGDRILEQLAKATLLVELYLSNVHVTSAGFKHIAGLKDLERVFLCDTAIDDSGVAHLEGLSKVYWLWLGDTKVTSAGMESICKLTKLDTLLLHNTALTDNGLEHIGSLKSLKSLRLDGTKVTDAGLAHLSRLATLEDVSLDNTEVTDKGLVHLQNMPKLKEVRLKGSGVSDLGWDRLMLYLPANAERTKKLREQFERGDWPPKPVEY
jgi:hypothetical protein